ncbi:nicotinate-nucleotide--dimethylbenzimidazole phosphoribosyltransferase [Acetobacter ghanensis]|uniref:Nicotinate-nucleotide--dimethylbenzimidazole phosphoribosyltransferase n=1 Tax=Acetobacter ghanensis TaxID=431306 RepID=A0A0U5F466_9PROT|nr:nicotinate-nucleotide--dimethylbenzimidazole phosphoribosyltransferase [Acetobacter ghanensis]NHO39592.1 nicotinate-nucleotide--dimethylbenzimidazole phosphoribosyltransferase [Acetobacter ghanensis]CEF54833.1 nicotinate-nucleotide--dimethylbenzimidazole phosphoribosyltransferase [Acetobacter ghanensis]
MPSFSSRPQPGPPSSLPALRALCMDLPPANTQVQHTIAQREAELTKPPGSLGQLEEMTRWLGGWQHRAMPRLDHVHVLIFAGNHGVMAHHVSPWPVEVTAQMVQNFEHGGAAINQIARVAQAQLAVVPLHNLTPTNDFTQAPAMTEQAFMEAVQAGFNAVPHTCDLLCLGEMGIGNTTAASALCAALTRQHGADWAGQGTGLDMDGTKHKATIIDTALAHHRTHLDDPLEVARRLGGYELAATLGATLAARHRHIPVILDGFVCTAAVAPLAHLNASALDHTALSHYPTETGHTARLAQHLRMKPILSGLGLRLGEASGAALAIPILRAAVACHTGMATFAQAAVSEQI